MDANDCSKSTNQTHIRRNTFCHPLPKGASGLKVAFEFNDPFWSTLSKTAVFRNHVKTIDAIVTDDCAIIPHELLTEVGKPVHVGIYGTDMQSNLAIPIIWATLGDICSASNPSGESSAEPTLPYWAQIQEQVDILQREMMSQEDLEHALLQARESGTFDGPQGPKGDQGEPGIPGAAGKDGYTPIAGIDYWTQEEKNEMTASAAYMAAEKVQLYSDIVCEVAGNTISLEDASGKNLRGLCIYGKTTQNGIPTPDAPVKLESVVGDSGRVTVAVCGKNLLDTGKFTNQYYTIDGVLTDSSTMKLFDFPL